MKTDQHKISELLRKYREGMASDEDVLSIEMLLENGTLSLEDFEDVRNLERKVDFLETPSPSLELDNKFYQMLKQEKARQQRPAFSEWFSFDFLWPRLALGAFTFILGIAAGYFLLGHTSGSSGEVQALSNEVKDLKEMMMLSLLENESATDRLKAVSLTQDMASASDKVTRAMIETLNKDENVNVRLAALEALKPYCQTSAVRKALIESISKQDSPLVQIALADLMVSLQEKSSVAEFEKILKDKKTPPEVKQRIRKNIQVLI